MANLRRTEGKKTETDYLILFTDSRTHKGFFYSFCLFSFSLFFSRRRVNSSSSLPSMQWRSREGSSSPRSVVFATDFQHSSFSSSFFFKPHPQQLCAEGLSPPHLHYTYAHSKILKERHPPLKKEQGIQSVCAQNAAWEFLRLFLAIPDPSKASRRSSFQSNNHPSLPFFFVLALDRQICFLVGEDLVFGFLSFHFRSFLRGFHP